MSIPAARVAEFVRQWDRPRSHRTEIIYSVHTDPTVDRSADLTTTDLRSLLAEREAVIAAIRAALLLGFQGEAVDGLDGLAAWCEGNGIALPDPRA